MTKLHMDKRDLSSFLVRISKVDGGAFQGEVENLGTRKKREFRSLVELVTLCEEIMDEYEAPLPMLKMRSWESDEGSIEKQIDQMLNFMRRNKDIFTEECGKRDPIAEIP